MTIDGYDIAGLHCRQHRVTFGHSDVKSDSEWTEGAILPSFYQNHLNMLEMTLTIAVYGSSRYEIDHRISDLLARFLNPVTVHLDLYTDRQYRLIMMDHSEKEIRRNGCHLVDIKCSGYCFGAEVSASTSGTSLTLTNPGNLLSPLRLEIMPTASTLSLALTNVCHDPVSGADLPLVIRNVAIGNKITIDGMTGKVLQGVSSKVKDVDMWALPALLPGEQTITISATGQTVTAAVTPLYF